MHATIDTVAADLGAGEGNVFRANGSTIAKPGFIQVYLEGKDDANGHDNRSQFSPGLTSEAIDHRGQYRKTNHQIYHMITKHGILQLAVVV